jgi:glycosyltransferase involved in cell wall biosynthesis
MGEGVFISICIPAYKRITYLRRLLDSIQIQTYRGFEVVVTDDSPGSEVFELCKSHKLAGSIRYFKNEINLGTPENWNESIRRATGSWIKLMHDDDWFEGPDALNSFFQVIQKSPDNQFFFSGYNNVFLDRNKTGAVLISGYWQKLLNRDAKNLISRNVIGPPSVIIHKKNPDIMYDPALKWLVDIDFYIRYLEKTNPVLIPQILIGVGVSEDQVTKMVFRNPVVEIPENLYLLYKIGVSALGNIIVYDAYWRFLRNLNIRSVGQLRAAGYVKPIPAIIESMISFQSYIPKWILNTGLFSKFLMFAHYLSHHSKLTRG